jgi:hypothetical protein
MHPWLSGDTGIRVLAWGASKPTNCSVRAAGGRWWGQLDGSGVLAGVCFLFYISGSGSIVMGAVSLLLRNSSLLCSRQKCVGPF